MNKLYFKWIYYLNILENADKIISKIKSEDALCEKIEIFRVYNNAFIGLLKNKYPYRIAEQEEKQLVIFETDNKMYSCEVAVLKRQLKKELNELISLPQEENSLVLNAPAPKENAAPVKKPQKKPEIKPAKKIEPKVHEFEQELEEFEFGDDEFITNIAPAEESPTEDDFIIEEEDNVYGLEEIEDEPIRGEEEETEDEDDKDIEEEPEVKEVKNAKLPGFLEKSFSDRQKRGTEEKQKPETAKKPKKKVNLERSIKRSEMLYDYYRLDLTKPDVKDCIELWIYPMDLEQEAISSGIIVCSKHGDRYRMFASTKDGRKSISMEIDQFDFLARGKWVNGEFQSSVFPTGKTLEEGYEIDKEYKSHKPGGKITRSHLVTQEDGVTVHVIPGNFENADNGIADVLVMTEEDTPQFIVPISTNVLELELNGTNKNVISYWEHDRLICEIKDY